MEGLGVRRPDNGLRRDVAATFKNFQLAAVIDAPLHFFSARRRGRSRASRRW